MKTSIFFVDLWFIITIQTSLYTETYLIWLQVKYSYTAQQHFFPVRTSEGYTAGIHEIKP